jgi:hypothetical protein
VHSPTDELDPCAIIASVRSATVYAARGRASALAAARRCLRRSASASNNESLCASAASELTLIAAPFSSR